MRQEPYIDADLHGMTADQAIERITSLIKRANGSTYRIRIVHGYNRGNAIQRAIYRELGHGQNPKVLRVTGGENPGITELVLREYSI
ncbi:Smr/MutS family protein [Brotaphodocola sp.]|uniref:Smr/MutS family protein n=1 Tax=Brotaphodocola sp. TaxID=3073577 RepID=UPI003D7DF83B